jgi:hypothetical protein
MIPVSFRTLVWVGLSFICGGLLMLWLWTEWRQSVRERKARKKLRRCPLCFLDFEPDPAQGPPQACPRCGAPTL